MPTTLHLRRALLAAGALAALTLPATPAAALPHLTGRQVALPCLPGVTSCDSAPAGHHPGCANADVAPAPGRVAAAEDATLCLINRQRALHGRAKLHSNRALRHVAGAYASSMAVHNFFSHVSPGGSTFDQRIKDAGYLRGATGWAIGENIAWGSGTRATPREIVRAWMHSPEHRRNILDRHFRDAGLGIAVGLPVAGSGATYVNEFGRRSR